jgi:hypothetical protein
MIHRTRPFGPVLAVLGLLLAGTFVAPFALTACTSTSATSTTAALTQAIADARAVVIGVDQSYTALRTLYPTAITPATDAQVRALLNAAPAILAQLSTAADAATNAGGLRGVESLINQVLNITAAALANVPGVPPQMLLGLQAAAVLLPIIEMTAQTLVPTTPTVGAPPPRFASAMTPAQARVVLAR